MIKTNSQYPTRIKYVKHSTTQNGNAVTRFSIGDKIKGSEKDYVNYDVTVYADLDLQDNDEVVFASIDSIDSRVYNNKVYHSLVVTLVNPPLSDATFDNSEPLPFDI